MTALSRDTEFCKWERAEVAPHHKINGVTSLCYRSNAENIGEKKGKIVKLLEREVYIQRKDMFTNKRQ